MKSVRMMLMIAAFVGTAELAMAQTGTALIWPKGVPPQGATQKELFGSHLMYVGHRDKDGQVEIHKTQSDILIIQSGEADFLSGGEIEGATSTAPDELVGTSMKGGTKAHVGPGDVIHVAPGVAHQFLIKPGTKLDYLIVKVNK